MKKRYDKFILRWAKRYRIIKELGGKCINCGETNMFLLDLHHKEPEKKSFDISKYRNIQWDLILPEINKCVLLCRNCHTLHHFDDIIKRFNENFDEIKEKAKIVDSVSRPKLDEDYIYEMLEKKHSLNFIARSLKKDVSTIRDIAIRLEQMHNKKLFQSKIEYNKTKEKISDEQIIKCYSNGKKAKEIASEYNMCISTVFQRIQKLKDKKLIL